MPAQRSSGAGSSFDKCLGSEGKDQPGLVVRVTVDFVRYRTVDREVEGVRREQSIMFIGEGFAVRQL